jgi:hypothetical protein
MCLAQQDSGNAALGRQHVVMGPTSCCVKGPWCVAHDVRGVIDGSGSMQGGLTDRSWMCLVHQDSGSGALGSQAVVVEERNQDGGDVVAGACAATGLC